MVSLLVTSAIGCSLFVSALALPPNRMFGTAAPNPAERSVPSLAGNINPMILPDVRLNTSRSILSSSRNAISYWSTECDQDTVPPGWARTPRKHQIDSPVDCADAIFRVTRGGNPDEPQVWTSQADWSYRSCGVFLDPGWSYARVNIPRTDMAEIAQEIAEKCVTPENDFMGGWVGIGGYFILLLTGRESPEKQP